MKTIYISPSKSYAHRLLIAAALSSKQIKIKCDVLNDDILATTNALNALGANITYKAPYFYVNPIKDILQNNIINCVESGSTLRFIMPIACALGSNNTFIGCGELHKRPMDQLYNLLNTHNIKVEQETLFSLPSKCIGKLTPGKFTLNGNISSQYLTGLLFALPLLNGNSEVCIDGILTSKSYIDITLDVLKQAGIEVIVNNNTYHIKGNQQYNLPEYMEVEGDWSGAAFWIGAGLLYKEPICIKGLNINSTQGDKKIIDSLQSLGGKIEINNNDIIAYPSKLVGDVEIDCIDIPDLVPIISLCAARSKGNVKLKNVGRLRFKESNRLNAIKELLMSINILTDVKSNDLIIKGETKDIVINGNELNINTYNDHRIAMTGYIMTLLIDKEVQINYSNTKCITKSYTNFVDEFNKLFYE